jgi:ATP-dependent DNA helicase RecG
MSNPAHDNKSLETPVQYIKGIGPKRAAVLADRGIRTVRDLLYYFPFGYIDLQQIETIANLRAFADSGKWITVIGSIQRVDLIGRPPRQRVIMILRDQTGTIPLIFFRSINYFKKAFSPGEAIAVSGKVTSFRTRLQLVHPSIDRMNIDEEETGQDGFIHTGGIIPKYGSSEDLKDVNLHVKGLRRILKTTLDEYCDFIEDPLPDELRNRLNLIVLKDAIAQIHFPDSETILGRARRRLKFDELFSLQLLLALRRKSVKEEQDGISYTVQSTLARKLVDSLPFKLTRAQRKVIKDITDDMKSPKPMNRLLQGDVGSGKTVVALATMLVAVENGYQAAFMAPTEILAEQHYRTLSAFLKDLPVNMRLLIGGQRSKLRDGILEDIRRGTAQIVIGTHALIQSGVEYSKLGLVVIDEQHRFGVAQRMALREKALDMKGPFPYPDVLVMTATPIPRTLSMTLYGDLDVSVIDELPKDRKAIQSVLFTESQQNSLHRFIRNQVNSGRQVYIVYPLIEESEKLDLKAATESYEMFRSQVFSDLRLGLLHGRMDQDEKESVMKNFIDGRIDILVATTVIEVGIDVPNASVMVIEHAERFGLSQLHQLRGRVGRGAEQSYCLLVAPDWIAHRVKTAPGMFTPVGDDLERQKAVRRISTMLETSDGFKIAEIDLDLRGPGEFFGTRQSGLPELQIANLITDGEILTLARREAFDIIEKDPHLRLASHQSLRKYFTQRWKDALAFVQVG